MIVLMELSFAGGTCASAVGSFRFSQTIEVCVLTRVSIEMECELTHARSIHAKLGPQLR